VTAVLERARPVFESLGCRVEVAEPDFSDADFVFKAWRAWSIELAFGPMFEQARDQLKDTIVWNVERGRELSGPDLGRAERARTELYHRVREFMQTHEFLVLPVSQVPPFDVETPYPTEVAGVEMTTYIDWMQSCYFITATGLPAISVPCGFTDDGLPVGVQIVGRHQDDFGVLQLAHAFERETQQWRRRPPVVE
jgi:amidase